MELNCFSLRSYEDFLATLPRNPDLFKNKDFEADLYGELNPATLLDQLYFEQQEWLDFEAFLQHYVLLHGRALMDRFHFKTEAEFLPGLRARLYRTQFGFLTEYHACLLCAAFFGSENVFRSVALDKAGVDFQIRLHQQLYNVHIFVDNARAWNYRNYKSRFKKVDRTPGIHVNLPYALATGRFNSVRYLPNRFGVYQECYLQYFAQEAALGHIHNNNITGTTAAGFIYGQP